MSDKKITELPPGSDLAAMDLLAKVDDPNGAPVTQKITGAMLRIFIGCQLYQGRYPSAPDDPTLPALSYPLGGGGLSQWDIPTQQWV